MAGFFNFAGGLGLPNPLIGGTFQDTFKCYSMVFFHNSKEDAEHGGKIILPPSALERLARLNISYPMLFKLTNDRNSLHTHCGVLEFSAEEGRVYVPRWMLEQLAAQDGELIQVRNVSLPLATYSKFQPQSVDFLDITNPKAVLELKLRLFACLTKGDIIKINYNEKNYEMLVLETKPKEAVTIIECDMKVDFAPPVGYREPEPEPMETTDYDEKGSKDATIDPSQIPNKEFQAFTGQGQRLDGKTKNLISPDTQQQHKRERGIPNYNYKKGKITFMKAKTLKALMKEESMEETEAEFTAFSGSGQKLKPTKRKHNPC